MDLKKKFKKKKKKKGENNIEIFKIPAGIVKRTSIFNWF